MMWRMSRGNLKCVFVSVLLLWLFIFVCQCMFVRLCAVILVGIGKIGLKSNGRPSLMCFFRLSVWVFVWLLLFCVLCVYVLIKVVVEKKWVEEWGEAIAFVYFCACECLFVWLFLFIFYQRMCALRKSGLKSEESYLISVFVHVGLFVICLPAYVRDDKSGGWEKVGWRVRRAI